SRTMSRLLFLIFAFCLLPFAFRGAALLRDDREGGDFGALLGGTHGVARRGARLVGRGEELFELAFKRGERHLALEERGELRSAEQHFSGGEFLRVVNGLHRIAATHARAALCAQHDGVRDARSRARGPLQTLLYLRSARVYALRLLVQRDVLGDERGHLLVRGRVRDRKSVG